jgi:NADPH-dependent 2,4-dienoyl-CoA reductase/sulfur reductase-like enzyme
MKRQLDAVAVVGAGLAGARSVSELLAHGFEGKIHLVGAEPHLPYNRPPLSKSALLGDPSRGMTIGCDLSRVEVHLQTKALGLGEGLLHTDKGDLQVDAVVVATGSSPVRLHATADQHVLRTREDAERLRTAMDRKARIVIVGASWLGAEVASAATQAGCEVTCVEGASAPLARSLGIDVGRRTQHWWEQVDLRLDATVTEVSNGGVTLNDGTTISSDFTLCAVGSRPSVDWLDAVGVELDGGIVVDHRLLARLPEGHPWEGRIAVVGDASVWDSPRYGVRMRVEHWDDAQQGPKTAIPALLGHEIPVYDPIPYFWSEQFGHRLQYVGHHGAADQPVFREGVGSWAVAWLRPDDSLGAYLSVNGRADIVAARAIIDQSAPLAREPLTDYEAPLALVGP